MADLPDPTGTIVVPLDGSDLADRAVRVAVCLARPAAGRLVLVAVACDDHTEAMRTHLDEVAAGVADVPVSTVVAGGREVADAIVDVADAIVDVAAAHHASICMTSHGRGGLRWAVLGSVAERVVAASARPVLLVGPHCAPDWSPGPGPVVVAHDGSPMSDTLLGAACAWARHLDTSLLLTTVIHPLDAEDAERPGALFAEPEARIRAHGCAVDHLLVQRHFPAGVLADLAVERKAPLVVMASHGRHGLERLVLGSTTTTVLDLVPCPVLATPPLDRDRPA